MDMFSNQGQKQSQQQEVENDDVLLKEFFAEESDDDNYDYSADVIPSSYQVEEDQTTTLFTVWDSKVLSTCHKQRSCKEEEEICWLLLSE